MLTPEGFIEIIRREVRKFLLEKSGREYEANTVKQVEVKFGKVVADYVSGRPFIIFDGETTASGKGYPYLSSYTPSASDRVLIINGVIQGKIV